MHQCFNASVVGALEITGDGDVDDVCCMLFWDQPWISG